MCYIFEKQRVQGYQIWHSDQPICQHCGHKKVVTPKCIYQIGHTRVVTKNDNEYKEKEDFNVADLILDLAFLFKLCHISPMSPSSRVVHGAILKIGRYWNLSKFPLCQCVSAFPWPEQTGNEDECQIHPAFTTFIQFPKSNQLAQLT